MKSSQVEEIGVTPSSHTTDMFRNALRQTVRARPTLLPAVMRRGYAESVPADKIRLSLSLPHQAVFANKDV